MSFAHYLLQVNLYLIVFYGFYKLLLDKETYFTLNRFYLVASGLLSLTIPFIRLEWLTTQHAAQKVYSSINWNAVLEQATVITETRAGFNWANILVYVYAAGILFFMGRLIFNLFTVRKLIKTAKSGSAFSFFGRKIIDHKLPQRDVIDLHEEIHIQQLHTIDIIFFELIGIITWLNPVIYLYKKTIKNIHEFLADEQAAKFQGDKAEYALLILSKSFGISPNALTNGFFEKSLIKKRIYMLQKERSRRTAIMKYGIFIPLFALLIVFSSATVRKNENLRSLAEEIPLEKPLELMQQMTIHPIEATTETKVAVSVKDIKNNDWKKFYTFLGKTLKYPKEALESDLQGNAQVKFTLQNGRIKNLSKTVELGNGCDAEAIRAISAYKDFKEIRDGNYSLSVAFVIQDGESTLKNRELKNLTGYKTLPPLCIAAYKPTIKSDPEDPNKVFDFVSIDKQPEFPGGMKKFYEYLGKSIKYPELAQENNVQGKVFLSFIVERDGSLTDIKITRGLGSGTDEEATRVLSESPKWNPGMANEQAVRVKYNINVNFILNKEPVKAPEKITVSASLKQENGKGKLIISSSNVNDAKAPLIILDGVTLGKDALKYMNTNLIESISVLKDESATSIYGLKGVNGVILITSKTTKNPAFRKPDNKELGINKITTLSISRNF